MFDLGWSELFLIMVVTVLVIGPDELPEVMQTLGRVMRRLQYIRYAFSQQFEDIMKENGVDMKDLHKQVNFEAKNFDEKNFDEKSADEEEVIEGDQEEEKNKAVNQ